MICDLLNIHVEIPLVTAAAAWPNSFSQAIMQHINRKLLIEIRWQVVKKNTHDSLVHRFVAYWCSLIFWKNHGRQSLKKRLNDGDERLSGVTGEMTHGVLINSENFIKHASILLDTFWYISFCLGIYLETAKVSLRYPMRSNTVMDKVLPQAESHNFNLLHFNSSCFESWNAYTI